MSAFGSEPEVFDQTFENVEQRDGELRGREFNGCTFRGVQLAGSQLAACKFIDCRFERCDLSNVSVKGCTWKDVTCEDSKLLGINWTEAKSVAHCVFRKCVLNLANFSGLDLRKSVIHACVARELELGDANLAESDCRKTDFGGTRFFHTNLTKCDFREALNYAIRAGDNKLAKAKFSLPEATALLYGLDIILEE